MSTQTKAKPLSATREQYISLDDAYTYFNKALFNATLPPCFITFQRQKKSYGYYWHNKLASRKSKDKISEIALAINHFGAQNDTYIFSVLVHEMVHHWQYCFGKPSRAAYHNTEFAVKMKSVGLYPSHTGKPGGNETGQNMAHYIIKEGAFEKACEVLQKKGHKINWQSYEPGKDAKKKKNTKLKYTCPSCDCNVWGKDGLDINCNQCDELMEIVA